MKLIFTILLLVPLASAKIKLGSTLSSPTAIKMIFSKDLVITESFDFREILHRYTLFHLEIQTQHNSTDRHWTTYFQLPLKKLNGMDFVLENTFSNKSKDNSNYCALESSEKFSDVISYCSGEVRIRELNMGERHLVKKIRKEQMETGNPLKIVYDRKYMQTASFGLNFTSFSNWVYYGLGEYSQLYVQTVEYPKPYTNFTYMYLPPKSIEKSFVIDAFPPKSGVNCHETTLTDLKPGLRCGGDIQLRELKAEDKDWFRID